MLREIQPINKQNNPPAIALILTMFLNQMTHQAHVYNFKLNKSRDQIKKNYCTKQNCEIRSFQYLNSNRIAKSYGVITDSCWMYQSTKCDDNLQSSQKLTYSCT